MNATGVLGRMTRDHERLRPSVAVVQGALRLGGDTRWVLREVCYALWKQLDSHVRREDEAVRLGRQLGPEPIGPATWSHAGELSRLDLLNRQLKDAQPDLPAAITSRLQAITESILTQMADQDAVLLPWIGQALDEDDSDDQPSQPAGLRETMTVNELIRLHPGVQPVLTRLFVNIPLEGLDCLDEVAWRHGMTSEDLLERLEQGLRRADDELMWPESRSG